MDAPLSASSIQQARVVLESKAQAPFGSRTVPPQTLLTRLLALYWMGVVTQAKAASLVGIRREEFMELADLRRCALIIEAASWRYFLRAFNERFPECDRQLAYRHPHDAHGFEGRMYTDDELQSPERYRNSVASRVNPNRV